LVLQQLPAQRVVAFDLATDLLVLVDLGESEKLVTESTGNGEREDDFLYNSTGTSYTNVFVTTGTVLIDLEPVFNTLLAE
jgi:hypothetical protein